MEKIDGGIRTTVNMTLDRYKKIESIANKRGISLGVLIKVSIKNLSSEIRNHGFQSRVMSYQEPANNWKKPHINLTPIEYEMFKDLQKHCKCCLSLLAAIAIDKYTDLLENGGLLDSYPQFYYSLHYIVENNCPIYIFCWALPKKEIKITVPLLE
jgi:predicted DNA-binding ribbon-helix-helix protein